MNLKLMEAQETQKLVRCQKEFLELEVRKFRRRKLRQFHNLEQELLREVSSNVFFVVYLSFFMGFLLNCIPNCVAQVLNILTNLQNACFLQMKTSKKLLDVSK